MIILVLIVAIAAGLVPLLQRDLRIAHARIEARRRYLAMTPLQRAIVDAVRAMSGVGRVLAAGFRGFNEGVQRAQEAEKDRRRRELLHDALHAGRRRPRDRWSIR